MGQTEYVVLWVGAKIREERKKKKLKLNEISAMTGISIAMISKIENGRVFPTLPSLLQIIEALGLSLNSFFNDLPENPNFSGYMHFKKSEYQQIEKEEDSRGFDYRLVFNHNLEKSALEVSVLTLSPGASREEVTTEGLQLLFVAKGEIEYYFHEKVICLSEGDTLFFDGRIPHVPKNTSEQDAFLLVMYFLQMN